MNLWFLVALVPLAGASLAGAIYCTLHPEQEED